MTKEHNPGKLGLSVVLFLLPLFTVMHPSWAQEPDWYLLSRDDGCVPLQQLVKPLQLPRAPVSPEDFARMMRDRGEQVVVGPMADAPPELIGKVVQVRFGKDKAPLFIKQELCPTRD